MVALGPYLTETLTESEAVTLTRRLDALASIQGCVSATTRILGDDAGLRGMNDTVRFCVQSAMREDRPGVWRRRGAGAWSHVRAVIAGNGITPRFPDEGGDVCSDQVRAAIAESLCDAAIADLSPCRLATEVI